MANFEEKDRDNKDSKTGKPMGEQGQGQQGDRNKQQNEPGRESNVPREGQGQGAQRPGGGKPKSEDDEESA